MNAAKTVSCRQSPGRLRNRREFLAAARGFSWAEKGLVLQATDRGDSDPPKVGFTVTRKLGNAVVRNRIRRRLRAATRNVMGTEARNGFNYVVIGRSATALRCFDTLQEDLRRAMERVHEKADLRRKDGVAHRSGLTA